MKYAILYAALFYKFSNQETLRVLGERVLQTIKKLSNILGNPSFVYLSEELKIQTLSLQQLSPMK